jgi:hypothetical protein
VTGATPAYFCMAAAFGVAVTIVAEGGEQPRGENRPSAWQRGEDGVVGKRPAHRSDLVVEALDSGVEGRAAAGMSASTMSWAGSMTAGSEVRGAVRP